MLRIMDTTKAFGFKIETTPYTAETLTASNYIQKVTDVTISPEIESYARKLLRGDYSRDVSISGKRKVSFTVTLDAYSGPAAATAPQYFDLYRACGRKQTTHGATGVSVSTHAFYNRVPGTAEIAYLEEGATPRQVVVKVKGCMGKAKEELTQIGQPLKLTFEMQGALVGITTREYASICIPTGWDSGEPSSVLACTFSLFGTWQFPTKLTIDGGEDVQLFSEISEASGYDGARIVDRNVTGECDPDMVVTDDLDLYSPIINNTTGAMSLTIGGAIPLTISAPAVQITGGYTPEVREGHIANSLKLEFKRSSGNDELEILQGSKS